MTGMVAALAAVAYAVAAPAGQQNVSPAPAAVGDPGYAVEDFSYPNADQILTERGILLKRGNGHIVLSPTCADGLLRVWARGKPEFCFKVTGDSGYLSLELPAVYTIRGIDYDTTITMTVDDETKTYDIPRNQWEAVGEGADPERRDHTLVEIRTSK
ncbi:hypothetical protein [Streptomyces sp. CMB-StM0423]|uniref:hypothetical protein n=1 Tax=Streptomyces sp. CMB-StM0423 TaxID=2059884 RepID=UPI001F3F9359|nr:hypothetical protein [Streptomyces sp. CMB-StM0423]